MMPQFASKWNLVKNYRNIALGIFIFSIGLFKKVVIADTFAVWATNGFDHATTLNLIEAWATSLSYTFQLYFDFSGYADMAIGLGLLFNIMLPQNFNSPYKALNVIDFWSRWHMTLTRFLTTYIYEPIVRSGKKFSFNRAMIATVITMFLAGLWHGAAWTFVVFGLLHGFAIVLNHYWKKTKIKLNKVLAWFLTFNFLNLSFVIFRAKEWDDVFKIYSGMFSLDNVVLPTELKFLGLKFAHYSNIWLSNIFADKYLLAQLIAAFIIILFPKNSMSYLKSFNLNSISLLLCIFLLITSFLNLSGVHEFLYFNF
jgi:D-alanyl-lipoteichoic acid acyltransferase DltB (MBOAT superfamily)